MPDSLRKRGVAAIIVIALVLAMTATAAVVVAAVSGTLSGAGSAVTIALIMLFCGASAVVASRVFIRNYVIPYSRILGALKMNAPIDTGRSLSLPQTTRLKSLTSAIAASLSRHQEYLTNIQNERDELSAILQSMVEGVIVLDDELRVRSINRSAAAMFDGPDTDLCGKTLLQALRTTDLSDFAERVHAARAPLEENITLYRDGVRYLQVHGITLSLQSAGPGGVLLVLNDITRMKQLEQIRKDFVSNVSHELKTPVTSIKGFVETLIDGAMEDRERAGHFLRIILKQTDRIHDIIEDLLSLARLEQNESPIQTKRCDVSQILGASADNCRIVAHDKAIEIRQTISGEREIICNASLVEQAVTNLIDNAIKYSPSGTEVTVAVTNRPDHVSISVIDQGQGIPDRDLSRIFERFYRVDRARTRDIGGTGLGLAIVKHIAIAHGGEVEVISQLGKGSTFTLSLPQSQRENQ
ncbi:MAG TPA: ATP-binding protein [Spirochaetia bacterium]|nr:ATP-binding protein [Spirochaetia bacterium]